MNFRKCRVWGRSQNSIKSFIMVVMRIWEKPLLAPTIWYYIIISNSMNIWTAGTTFFFYKILTLALQRKQIRRIGSWSLHQYTFAINYTRCVCIECKPEREPRKSNLNLIFSFSSGFELLNLFIQYHLFQKGEAFDI